MLGLTLQIQWAEQTAMAKSSCGFSVPRGLLNTSQLPGRDVGALGTPLNPSSLNVTEAEHLATQILFVLKTMSMMLGVTSVFSTLFL